jgi:hypothetical protein
MTGDRRRSAVGLGESRLTSMLLRRIYAREPALPAAHVATGTEPATGR